MKKIVNAIIAAASFAVVAFAPVKVQAALPCTYDIIYDANGKIANAQEMLAMAEANLAAAKVNYESLKASGNATQLQLLQATDAITNATNVCRWWVDQVNNGKTYLSNIKDREKFEDKFAANRIALADLNKLQLTKLDADNAKDIANSVLNRINDVKKEIIGYENQVASNPGFQAQIDSLRATLSALEADYAAKLDTANAKAQLFQQYLKELNYSSYDKAFEDYQYQREINRGNVNWTP